MMIKLGIINDDLEKKNDDLSHLCLLAIGSL